MDYIRKLPFILSVLAAIITGVIGLMMNYSQSEILLRMSIGILVFLILGIFARYSITGIYDETVKKQELEEQEEQEKARQLELEAAKQKDEAGSIIDLTVNDDSDDSFTPLDLSKAVRTKLTNI